MKINEKITESLHDWSMFEASRMQIISAWAVESRNSSTLKYIYLIFKLPQADASNWANKLAY